MQSKTRRRLGIFAMLVAAILLVLVFAGLPLALSGTVVNRRVQFRDPLAGKVPSDFGIPYQDISFSSDAGILRGWYLPGASSSRTLVIFCHGLNRSRVELLPQSQFAHQLGL